MQEPIPPIAPDREIISERTIFFPMDLVRRAWSEEEHLKAWWGPSGFTNTFEEFDFREGGRWKFIMHGQDKGHYQNECTFTHIEPGIIAWQRISKPLFKVVFKFQQMEAGSTHVLFRMIFDTPEECEKIKRFAVEKNEENFDRLEKELEKMAGISVIT